MHSVLSHCTNSIHAIAGDVHHSASPMGLWLLLAVAASATPEDSNERREVEKALGLPVDQALCVVEELLDGGSADLSASTPVTEALQSAMVLWLRKNSLTELKGWAAQFDVHIDDSEQDQDLYAWRDSLPGVIETGDIPTNEEADKWVSDKTSGLLKKLPLEIEKSTFLVLLSAIATKTKWREPFTEAGNGALSKGSFANAEKILISAESHDVYVEDTEIGMVGVHVAHGTNGLDVYSVIADPAVNYIDVIRVAHEISAQDRGENLGVPLHQLEVEGSDIYELSRVQSSTGDNRVAYLPKWKTVNSLSHLQDDRSLGFRAIAESIAKRSGIKPDEADVIVQQDVVAEYTASGFDAAAVTQMMMRVGIVSVPRTKEAYLLEILFNHPYAVVAVVRDKSSWTGTPIFSSWVKEAL